MPFGVTWGQYLKMWGVSITGFACGSQLIHSQYQPMANMDKLVEEEVERLREEKNLSKPTFDDKMKKVLVLDQEYIKKFNIGLKKE